MDVSGWYVSHQWPRVMSLGLVVMVVMAFGALLATGQEATPPGASACVPASPQADSGSPVAAASPADMDPMDADAPRLGTPVAGPCLTVTLQADGTAAGPRQLVVTVVDAGGAPVADATVTIGTHHLGMDHGTSTAQAIPAEPGQYAIDQVSMGMGGTWQADVVITRPGYEPITVTFLIDLEGPH